MAQVILSMEEYQALQSKALQLKSLKQLVRASSIFKDNCDCWNKEEDIVRCFDLEETKQIFHTINTP